MKIISYRDAEGETYGVAAGDGIVEVGRASGLGYADLKAVLEAGALDKVRDFASGRDADVTQDSVTFFAADRKAGQDHHGRAELRDTYRGRRA